MCNVATGFNYSTFVSCSSATGSMDLECDVCFERFDGADRLPKVLPCGHTVCLQCLRRLPHCPTCRRDFNKPPEGPVTNFLALNLLEGVRLGLSAAQDAPPAAAPTPPAAVPPPSAAPLAARGRKMNVRFISVSGPYEDRQEKTALLRDAPGVTRLVNLRCHMDPAWSLQLLQCAAPTLERLSVSCLREAHLRAAHAMPRLRRLDVDGNDAALDARPPVLPALPPGHAGLQWLRVYNIPRATTQSLLRAHGGTLEELELVVGTAGKKEWPLSCDDLHSLLQQSGLRALRRIVMQRFFGYSHKAAACSEQLAEVRRVLPGALVLCTKCDRVRRGKV
ncbi:uncharacterized protein LOC113209648 [Frankliniella occidentalis]|uniref:Uncharacterized protein LOC113209648 n=1 Tax=Frankliniella occidentalis TaxID=133901 RepID=A0A9C6UA78_FRAOC|nr:uncharacterized protein LOC113209648 [Frankliniella occidentalis]